jgi:general stress protein 26
MYETPEELSALQDVLDRSAAGAGSHLSDIITNDRRVDAAELSDLLTGMQLLVVATVTADGRPLAGPVDGYFIHGSWYFSSGRESVRMRHLKARPGVSGTHLRGEALAITVHGAAELFDVNDPKQPALRQAMLDHYLPLQGTAFDDWLKAINPVGARIKAEKLFTFRL